MDGADGWTDVADIWAELWEPISLPARDAIIAAAGIDPGTRVLDVGCGSGAFIAQLHALGALAAGVDPAPHMVELAQRRTPNADIRLGGAESLPWSDASFEVVTAVNALQFADDTMDALGEFARVAVQGGRIAIANWAEGSRNDLDVIERAVAASDDSELPPDGDLRHEGGLDALLVEAGFALVASGLVETPWSLADDDALVRGILMGEDPSTIDRLADVVIRSAHPFRTSDGGYLLRNAFRYAVARRP